MSKKTFQNQILIVGDILHEVSQIKQLLHERIFSPAITIIDLLKAESEVSFSKFDIIILCIETLDRKTKTFICSSNNPKNIPVIIITDNESIADYQNNKRVQTKNIIIDCLPKDGLNSLLLFKSISYCIELSKQYNKHKTLQQRYRDLFYMNPLPMWVYDLESLRFYEINDAAINKYGFSRKEYMQMTLRDIRPPEDVIELKKAIKFLRKNKEIFSNRIYRHQKKDGSIIYVELVSNIIYVDKAKYGLVMANDITESLNYMEAIENQNSRLQEIAFNYSHIIRAPLANIMGVSNLLKETDINSPEYSELLEHLFTSCIQLDEKIAEVVQKSATYPLTSQRKIQT
ncbi:PAS domain S-box protein [Flavobacterium aestuarii]|uniref:PAS domain S-box protein n=1 Tax=Flavobacterium aestuarii TaxID=3149227 RepID=UPI0032B3E6A8